MKRKHLFQMCLMFAIVLILASCQNNEGQTKYKVIVANPIIMTHDMTDAGMDMAISGTLTYQEENQCMYITEETDGNTLLAIWPKGTVPMMDNNQYGVNVKGIGPILEGEAIELGGGGIDQTEIESAGYPEECMAEVDQVVLINSEA